MLVVVLVHSSSRRTIAVAIRKSKSSFAVGQKEVLLGHIVATLYKYYVHM